MRFTLRIVVLFIAVLGAASLASGYACWDDACAHTDCEPQNCQDCYVSGSIGTVSVEITDGPICDGDGDVCDDTDCANPETLRVQSTVYYQIGPGYGAGTRDVIACEMWIDCDDQEVCKRCTDLIMTPSFPADSEVLDPFICEELGQGEYQYSIRAFDMTTSDCECASEGDVCENGCGTNDCVSGIPAQENSCCFVIN